MRASRLIHRVTFQRQASVDDGYGNARGAWSTLFTVWGDLRATGVSEGVEDQAITATTAATLTVRATTDTKTVTAADRVLVDGATWNIVGTRAPQRGDVATRRGWLLIDLRAGVAT